MFSVPILSRRFLLGGRSRVVVGKKVKVLTVGCADRLKLLVGVGAGCGFRGFPDDPRLKEAAGMLEIGDQIDRPVARPHHAHMNRDVAVLLVHDRLQRSDLDAAG